MNTYKLETEIERCAQQFEAENAPVPEHSLTAAWRERALTAEALMEARLALWKLVRKGTACDWHHEAVNDAKAAWNSAKAECDRLEGECQSAT